SFCARSSSRRWCDDAEAASARLWRPICNRPGMRASHSPPNRPVTKRPPQTGRNGHQPPPPEAGPKGANGRRHPPGRQLPEAPPPAHRPRPGLAAVLAGDNAASRVYVRNKRKACEQAGLDSWLHELPADTTQAKLLDLIAALNADAKVHGILVQLPLPKQIDE